MSRLLEPSEERQPSPVDWDEPASEKAAPEAGVKRFPALRHHNFRLFWFGNLVSLFGTLAQQAAQSWLVRDKLTDNTVLIAVIAACGTAPFLVLTLYAGVVADQVDKRRALIILNAIAAGFALFWAALVHFQVFTIWNVALLTLIGGVVNAFDVPVRQAFNSEMVPQDDLPNAIALNSTAFNSARVAGPALGGFLIHAIGMAGCFLANAVSFAALIWGLSRMDLPPRDAKRVGHGLEGLKQGFLFVRGHETLWLVTLLVGVCSTCAMSFGTLLSVFAKDIFQTDARGFSILLSCNGMGALVSAFSLAVAGKMRHRGKRLLLGAFLFCLSVMAFSVAPNFYIACFWLIAAGWFLLTFLTTGNTLVQTLAPEDMRGRVFSLYSLALIGTAPVGALLLGTLARVPLLGPRGAVFICAWYAAMFTFSLYWRFKKLWKLR
jgi:MFS family permease